MVLGERETEVDVSLMLPLVWRANTEVMIPAICYELMKSKDRPDKTRLDMSGREYIGVQYCNLLCKCFLD